MLDTLPLMDFSHQAPYAPEKVLQGFREQGGLMAAIGRSLRLMEVFRTAFYTPIYVSVAGGFLESQGLDVTFMTRPPQFANVTSALEQGAVDISGSGIMNSIILADGGADTVPAHIAKINARDGFFILSRRTDARFQWETLRGATIIPVGFSAMPPASFQFALQTHGSHLPLSAGG